MKKLIKPLMLFVSLLALNTACDPARNTTAKKVNNVGSTNKGAAARTDLIAQAGQLGYSFNFQLSGLSQQNDGSICVTSNVTIDGNSSFTYYQNSNAANQLQTCHNASYLWVSNFIYTRTGGASFVAKCSDQNCSAYTIVFNLFKPDSSGAYWQDAGQIALLVPTQTGQIAASKANQTQQDNQALVQELESTYFGNGASQ